MLTHFSSTSPTLKEAWGRSVEVVLASLADIVDYYVFFWGAGVFCFLQRVIERSARVE